MDDGSHRPEHIREHLRLLFPLLPDDGIYAIEDTQTSYWPTWGGSRLLTDPATSMSMVKDLVDGLNWEEFVDDDYRPTYTDRHVRSVHAYHNLVIIEKGDNVEGTNYRNRKRTIDGQPEPPPVERAAPPLQRSRLSPCRSRRSIEQLRNTRPTRQPRGRQAVGERRQLRRLGRLAPGRARPRPVRLDRQLGPAEHHPAALLEPAVPAAVLAGRRPLDDLHRVVEADPADPRARGEHRPDGVGAGRDGDRRQRDEPAVGHPIGQPLPRLLRARGGVWH